MLEHFTFQLIMLELSRHNLSLMGKNSAGLKQHLKKHKKGKLEVKEDNSEIKAEYSKRQNLLKTLSGGSATLHCTINDL